MNRKWIVIFLACSLSFKMAVAGGGNNYSVLLIPDSLLKGANVVKRMETLRFEITEKNRARYFHKVAYTILNEAGEKWASCHVEYDKLRSVEAFDGTLFDSYGNKLKSLKKADIKDGTGGDDGLADDYRYKYHNFYYKVYPYTVEYEVEVYYKGTMFLPDWIPQERPVMSVQQSTCVVVAPAGNPLRYKMYNYKGSPSITAEGDNKRYTWEVKNLTAGEWEYAMPAWHTTTTSVFMASENFMLEDYQGSNASWKDFGKFVFDLKKGKDALPSNVKQAVHELTNGITDKKEIVKRLYEYLQQNTRYISVQLGIGGWQPFDAQYVSERKYGDCKALSNFMYALLKEAGIRSVYTLIRYGNDPDYLEVELPCLQFNHAVLFVPDGKDTTWLECTSQTNAAGYMGSIGNRYALAVDENGGTLVRTPRYGKEENLELRHITAVIDEEGKLDAKISTRYMAEQQDRLHGIINGLSKDKLMEFLKEDIELATYDIRSYKYEEEKSKVPAVKELLDLTADHYATVSGKRLFILPNIITRTNRKLKPDENRKYELVLSFEFKDIDTTQITVPAGYTAESVPQDVKIESRFGKYTATVKFETGKIVYTRHYEHYSGRFPPKEYNELVKFYDAVYKADRNRVVLVKNEPTKAF